MYVQFGCGFTAPAGWENFDASPTLVLERLPLLGRYVKRNNQRFPANVRFGDIVRGLPFESESVDGVYCSHILEHLAADDMGKALQNTFKLLRPNAYFRIVVPDLKQLAKNYVADSSSEAAHRFMRDSCLGYEQRPRGTAGFLKSWFGNSPHLWMWDEASLGVKLSEHGFINVRRAYYGDSEDPRFMEVENSDRFDGCLGMQCTKP